MTPSRRRGLIIAAGAIAGGLGAVVLSGSVPAPPIEAAPTASTAARPAPPVTVTVPPISTAPTTTLPTRVERTVPGWTVGRPWPDPPIGLTMFRGNPTRTWYGTGPLPDSAPGVLWEYPDEAMCGSSVVAGESSVWCGSGWTGQPAIWERPDGVTEVIFGAYDKAVHFVDAATGKDTRAPFPVGDIIKGSVSLDPDGFPIIYTGSRDNKLRAIALDREPVAELWSLDADAVPGIWNDDWDGNPVILDDLLLEGGENGWFFVVKLNRGYAADGLVTVSPEVIFQTKSWTDEQLATTGRNVSIENSVAVFDQRVYFANSGGRVVGIDISRVDAGQAHVVFDYWAGDDIDASIVIDEEGMLYVAIEQERKNQRSAEVGQLIKLDPRATEDPLVWGIPVTAEVGDGGIWATPALGFGHLYVPTHTGRLLAVDTTTGEITWEEPVGPHAWSSAVVIDDRLVVATCETAELRAYSLAEPARPERLWTLAAAAGGCIESTPAVWEGRIYVGSRDGFLRAYG
jgi:outer membrane protein assembly factor BamB